MRDYTVKLDDAQLGCICVGSIKPEYNFTFGNDKMPQVGKLDFNGDKMEFTGDADEAAKVFLTLVDQCFQQRLKDEYNKGLERAACIAQSISEANQDTVPFIANAIRKEISNEH